MSDVGDWEPPVVPPLVPIGVAARACGYEVDQCRRIMSKARCAKQMDDGYWFVDSFELQERIPTAWGMLFAYYEAVGRERKK